MNKCSHVCKQKEDEMGSVISFLTGMFLIVLLGAFFSTLSIFNLTFLDNSLPKQPLSHQFERVEFSVESVVYNPQAEHYDIVMRSGPFLAEFSCHAKPSESLKLSADADLYVYKAVSGTISHVAKPFGPYCLYMIGQMMKDAESDKDPKLPVRKVKPKGQSMIAVR